jgi:hypothetical protein
MIKHKAHDVRDDIHDDDDDDDDKARHGTVLPHTLAPCPLPLAPCPFPLAPCPTHTPTQFSGASCFHPHI